MVTPVMSVEATTMQTAHWAGMGTWGGSQDTHDQRFGRRLKPGPRRWGPPVPKRLAFQRSS